MHESICRDIAHKTIPVSFVFAPLLVIVLVASLSVRYTDGDRREKELLASEL